MMLAYFYRFKQPVYLYGPLGCADLNGLLTFMDRLDLLIKIDCLPLWSAWSCSVCFTGGLFLLI